jgi:hypothetical protein
MEDNEVKDGLCVRCLGQRRKDEMTWLAWLVVAGVFVLATAAQLWKQVAR